MLAVHCAAALVPYELSRKHHKVGFWLFLFAAQFLDILMLLLMNINFERVESNYFNLNRFLSHGMPFAIMWTAFFGMLVFAITKQLVIAGYCVALILFHEVCDHIIGFEHALFDTDSTQIGFAFYSNAPILGILIEALMCAVIVFWFCHRRAIKDVPVSLPSMLGLYLIFVGGALFMIPLISQAYIS